MNNTFVLNLKLVKHCLKNKKRITVSLIVTFLITGGVNITPIFGRDLRTRQKEKNNVIPDNSGGGGPGMNTAANGADVVNIVDANQDGISHNKFIDLSVGFGNSLIFNNSMEHGVSQLGGYVTKNTNLTQNASVILNEVRGNNISTINGGVEVFGPRADFILANENGISLNGATFINTNGVTLATGTPTVDRGNINFNVSRGEIDLNGVGTSGSYFNVLAKTVKIQKEISNLKDETVPDISIIAGDNKIRLEKNNLGSPKITESRGTTSDKYGIYATQLGAMYGKNIKLISTDNGLGVKHEGLIYSSEDIEINSKGDIVLANISAKNNLKITGEKGLSTINGTYKNDGVDYSNSLTVDKNIDIDVKGDIKINSGLQSVEGNIDIYGNSLENSGIISADKNLKVVVKNLLNSEAAVIKADDIDITSNNGLINHGEIRQNLKEKNEFVSSNGKLKFNISFGNMENFGNISGEGLTILTQSLVNGLNAKIIITDGDILLTTTLGDFINMGDILTDKNISIISNKDIRNIGKIGANDVIIQGINGEFFNAGQISAVNKLQVIVNNLINAGNSQEIEKYLGEYSEYITINLDKVNLNIKALEEKIKNETSQEKLSALKESLNYFVLLREKFENLRKEVSKVGELGILSGKDVDINSKESIENKGLVISQGDIKLEAGKNIVNAGVIEADKNIFIKAIENVTNSQRIVAKNNLEIEAKSFSSMGNELKIKDYLNLVKDFDSQKLEDINKKILELESKLASEENLEEVNKIKKELEVLKENRDSLNSLKAKISAFENLGVLEGMNISIKTVESLENNGIILSKENVTLKSDGDIKSTGSISVGNDIEIIGKSFISNTLTAGGKLKAILQQTFSGKDTIIKSDVEITAKDITNYGKLYSNEGVLKLIGDLFSDTNGDISAKNDIILNGKVNNKGSITSSSGLKSTSGKEFLNAGNIDVQKNIEILTNNFNSSGNINVGEKLTVDSTGEFLNSGKIEVKDEIKISANTIGNQKEIKSKGNIVLKSTDSTINSGEIYAAKELEVTAKNLKNSGEMVGVGVKLITTDGIENTGSLQSEGDMSIKNIGTSDILNSGGILATGNISIDAKDSYLTTTGQISSDKEFEAKLKGMDSSGKISAKEKVDIALGNRDSNLGNIITAGNINISSNANLTNGKVQGVGDIKIDTTGSLTNKGMIISNSNINIKSKNFTNENGNTVWAGKNIIIEVLEGIYNKLAATIEAVGDMSLTAKNIINEGGTIKSGKNMILKADSVENKSNIQGELDVKYEQFDYTHVWKESWDAFNHWDTVSISIPIVTNNKYVKDKATISAGGNLKIEAKTTTNYSGTISAGKDIDIVGNLTNRTHNDALSVEWFLQNTTVTLKWATKTLGLDAPLSSGTSFTGTLDKALKDGHFSGANGYYEALTKQGNEQLGKVLSALLGGDWKGRGEPVSQDKWDYSAAFKYYASNSNAQIFAGGNFASSGGAFNNDGGETGSNKNVSVDIGDFTVNGSSSELDVNIKDINLITELGPIKLVNKVEIITGEVTIDGVTIKAETGNTAGSIAVAGTINPIIFIKIPEGENGIFRPATLKPGGFQPLFETNIEFIDQSNMYGSKYFLEQIGYDISRPTTVIGDIYYELMLLQAMLEKTLGYTGTLTNGQMKALLDNGVSISKNLELEVGKPLTPNQINNLEKDIIWYVEVEINGVKALTPQIYLSKESRINIAKNQGSGGSSTIKVGGDIIVDSTDFNNSNGNITGNGNIIIKSEKDINNNSSGGMGGGITSNGGNIALDAKENINMNGGHVTGDNVILAGKDINISSSVGIDRDGNQTLSDKGGITASSGIQIDAKKDVNLKGATLTANGVEIKEKEKEEEKKEEETTEESTEEKVEESTKKAEEKVEEIKKVEKNIDYYKELFKKDSKDIIEGDAGSININAGGSVNIEDIYTVSSDAKYNYTDYTNYDNEINIKASSNGSNIKGSNINIKAEEEINLKGSSLSTNLNSQVENKKVGSINLDAKKDINILDSQDVSFVKKDSKKSSMEDGLYTEKASGSEKNSSLSKGSKIDTDGELIIKSGKDITIQGSKLSSDGKTNISSEGDVNILDGRNEVKEKSYESRYQVIGGSQSTTEKRSSESKGSVIEAKDDISVSAKNNVKIINGNLSGGSDINLKAGKNVSIEAGKNEYHETTESFGVGLYVDGSVGVAGVGVSGSADTIDMKASGKVTDDFYGEPNKKLDGSNEKTPTTSGKPHMDQLVNSEVGVKIQYNKTVKDDTKWNESSFGAGGNLNITAGEVVDIGGGDYSAKGDVTIEGSEVKSTKYEDTSNSKSTGFELAIKQSQGVNSAVADTINKSIEMDESIKSGQGNNALLAVQGIGAATNLIFNDLAGVFSKQSVNLSVEDSEKSSTKENITTIEGKNVTIKATKGNIDLNGVDISGEENVSLDAKKNINIKAAKETSNEKGFKVDLEAQFEQTAGYSALWGANTDVGVGGSVSVGVTSKNSETYTNANIKSKGNISVKAGEDTNIIGGNIEADKNVDLDIKGNLNITSVKSKYESHDIKANAGGNVSIGGSSNTIGKAELGFNAGGGDIWEKGERVEQQSGIKAGEKLTAEIGKDVNLEGAILGSVKNEGTLKVGGSINSKDLTTSEKKDGAQLTFSGGFTGDFGADGTIGDSQNKQVTTKSVIGLNTDNISVGGDINIDGIDSKKEDIYTNMEKTQIVDFDEVKKGGSLSLSGSTQNIKDTKDKVNKVKDYISSKKNDSVSSSDGGGISNSKNEKDSKNDVVMKENPIYESVDKKPEFSKEEGGIKKEDSEPIYSTVDKDKQNENILESPPKREELESKYDILDSDNPFDFPKDDGVRIEIKDTANESLIVPVHYEPLNAIPENAKLQEKKDSDSDKKILEKLLKDSQEEVDKLEKELGDLLSEQGKILEKELKKKKLTDKDKEKLNELQLKLEDKIKELNRYKELELGMENNLKTYLSKQQKEELIYDDINNYLIKDDETINRKDSELIYEEVGDFQIKDNGFIMKENPIYESIEKIGLPLKDISENVKAQEKKDSDSDKKILEKLLKDSQERVDKLEKELGDLLSEQGKILEKELKKKKLTDKDKEKLNELQLKLEDKIKELNRYKELELGMENNLKTYLDKQQKEEPIYAKIDKIKQQIDRANKAKKDLEELLNPKKLEIIEEKMPKLPPKIEELGSKYDILDSDNPFDFPKDDGVRIEIKDTANESLIVPVHYEPLNAIPENAKLQEKIDSEKNINKNKNNNNLESNIDGKALGDSPLVYGTSDGRRELVSIGEKSLNKGVTVADSYVGQLNLGYNFRQLVDFATKVKEGILTEKDINDIAEFRDKYYDDSLKASEKQMSRVSPESNKELLDLILNNQEMKDSLVKIAELDKLIKDDDPKTMEKFDEELMNFFALKTKLILEKTLERDGQIYFTLNEVVMKRNGDIDFDSLLKVFDKNDENYNSVTSNELRLVLSDYLESPNLKFLLKKQVIELPPEFKLKLKDKLNQEGNTSNSLKDTNVKVEKEKPLNPKKVEVVEENRQELPLKREEDSESIYEEIENFQIKDDGFIMKENPIYESIEKIGLPLKDISENVKAQEKKDSDSDKKILEKVLKDSQEEVDKLEKELGDLLSEQGKILEKELKKKKLTDKDKEKLNELQLKLEDKTEELNRHKKLELGMENNLKTYLDKQQKEEPIYEELNDFLIKDNIPIKRENSEPIYAKIDKIKQQEDRENKAKKDLDELLNPKKLEVVEKKISKVEILKNTKEVYSKGNDKNKDTFDKNLTFEKIDLEGKKLEEALDLGADRIKKLLEAQLQLKNEAPIGFQGKLKLDKEFNLLKESVKEYIEKSNSDISLESLKLKKEIEQLLNDLKEYEENNEKYFSGNNQEVQELSDELKIITRSQKDIQKNLKTVAEYKGNIPEEHLLNYLKNVIKNSDFDEARDQLTGDGYEVLVKNPILKNTEESEIYLSKIYKDIFDKTDPELYDALFSSFNEKFVDDVAVKNFIQNKEVMTPDSIKKIGEHIQNIVAESYEETLDGNYKKINIKVEMSTDDISAINNGESITIFLNPRDTKEDTISTIVHELIHQNQKNLKDAMVAGFEDRHTLYNLNESDGGYIKLDSGKLYREQPIESEAYEAEKRISDYLKSLKPVEEKNKYAILDGDNAFDFPKDDGVRIEIKDTANEPLIVKTEAPPLLFGNPEDYKENLGEKGSKPKVPPKPKNLELPVKLSNEDTEVIYSEIVNLETGKINNRKVKAEEENVIYADIKIEKPKVPPKPKKPELSVEEKAPVPPPRIESLSSESKIIERKKEVNNLKDEIKNKLDKLSQEEKELSKKKNKTKEEKKQLEEVKKEKKEIEKDKENKKILEKKLDEYGRNLKKLLKEQERIIKKENLSSKDEKNLEKLEKRLKEKTEKINKKFESLKQISNKYVKRDEYMEEENDGWEEVLVIRTEEGPSRFNDNMSPNSPAKVILEVPLPKLELPMKEKVLVSPLRVEDLSNESEVIKENKKKLSQEERKAINDYVENGFFINEVLRNNKPLTEQQEEFIKNMDEALSKMPNYQGDVQKVLYIPKSDKNEMKIFLEAHKKGKKVKYDAYTSTARLDIKKSDLPSNIILNIMNTSSGKDITTFNKDEGEVIFERGSEFIIENVKQKNGKYIIEMKEYNEKKVNKISDAEKKFKEKFKKYSDTSGYLKRKNEIIRTNKEVEKQIDIILKEKNDIPGTHIQEYLGKVILNKEVSGQKGKIEIRNEDFKISDDGKLFNLYKKIPNRFEITQEKINEHLTKDILENNELQELLINKLNKDIKLKNEFLKKYRENRVELYEEVNDGKYMTGGITDNSLVQISQIVQKSREEVLKKVTGIEYRDARLNIINDEDGPYGYYNSGTIGLNEVKLKKISDVLDTVLHESTHLQQDLIRNDKKSNKIIDEVKELYDINFAKGAYIKWKEGVFQHMLYKQQPVEKEAFEAMRGEIILRGAIDEAIKKIGNGKINRNKKEVIYESLDELHNRKE